MKKIKGKIGFCDNKTLGIYGSNGKPLQGGHYVYIREVNGKKCNVNVITSLEDKKCQYDLHKIEKVKKGFLYPIPKKDCNLPRWSAINLSGNIKEINCSKIKRIGSVKMKTRHKFFVGKFSKK